MKVLQLPEGLKHKIKEFADRETWVVLDPCYGACDVRWREAKRVGAKKLVHVGHEKVVDAPFDIEYVPLEFEIDVEKVVEALSRIDGKKMLYTVAQYKKWLGILKEKLLEEIVGAEIVLGCRVPESRGEVNIFLGDGKFHALQIRRVTGKKTYVVQPDGCFFDIEEDFEKWVKEREKVKAVASGAETWGVVVSTKDGQINVEKALEVKKALEEEGKKVFLFLCDYFYPEYIVGIPVEAYVFTGCPRVALDDWKTYKKPVLTPEEVMEWVKGSS